MCYNLGAHQLEIAKGSKHISWYLGSLIKRTKAKANVILLHTNPDTLSRDKEVLMPLSNHQVGHKLE